MGIVTPTPFPTYPQGFPHDVIDPFMHRTGRGVLGNRPASGTEIIQELGEEHQRTGKWIVYTSADSVFQIAAHEETIPLEELYEACRTAREILTGKHAVGRVIARPFIGEPGRVRADSESPRLLARAAPAELPDTRARGRQEGARRREDRRHLRRLRHRRVASDEVQRRGHPADGDAPARARRRLGVHQSRRDRHALGPPQRPGQLPPLPAGLRPPVARPARRASATGSPDPHLGPRLRSRRRRRPTTRASMRSCSSTSRGATRPAGSTRASSPMSARASTCGSAGSRRAGRCRASRSSSREAERPRARSAAVRDRGRAGGAPRGADEVPPGAGRLRHGLRGCG